MFYAIKLMGGEWVELECSRDQFYLYVKYLYEDVDIIGGW